MATPAQHRESRLKRGMSAWDLDLQDDRIMIDIETDRMIRSQMQSTARKPASCIPKFLLEGRTLGPLSVLLVLVLYALLSPLLSPAIHEYMYRILH